MFSFLNNALVIETIPASKLGYNTNNRFPNFPPIMADGRAVISSWQPEAVINDRIIKDNDIKSNWQYRRFISKNANAILANNMNQACNDTGYSVSQLNTIQQKTPYLYKSIDDTTTNVFGNSDLKELYLSRERLDARKIAPSMTQAELIQTYGISPKKL